MNNFFIVDTTLRDGEQTPGLSFSLKQKIEIARIMDAAEIFQIEAGVPAGGVTQIQAISEIKDNVTKAFVSSWNRLNEKDVETALRLNTDILHISVPASDIQIEYKLKTTKIKLTEELFKLAGIAAKEKFVTIGLEDASRADTEFLGELTKCAISAGAKRVRFSDTVGILHPSKATAAIGRLKNLCGSLEIHCHDDFGMAAANTFAAFNEGARYVNTTFCGLGERAGNCDIIKFMQAAREQSIFRQLGMAKGAQRKIKRVIYSK
jgi:homocitrate synthase NifV